MHGVEVIAPFGRLSRRAFEGVRITPGDLESFGRDPFLQFRQPVEGKSVEERPGVERDGGVEISSRQGGFEFPQVDREVVLPEGQGWPGVDRVRSKVRPDGVEGLVE